MKKLFIFLTALFMATLQFIAFFTMVVPARCCKDVYDWPRASVWRVVRNNTRAAWHTIREDWKGWWGVPDSQRD